MHQFNINERMVFGQTKLQIFIKRSLKKEKNVIKSQSKAVFLHQQGITGRVLGPVYQQDIGKPAGKTWFAF